MDAIAAYRDVGSYRGAAEICGTTHKTVKRIMAAHEAGLLGVRKGRGRSFDAVADLVADRVEETQGKISAKTMSASPPSTGSDPTSAGRRIRSPRAWWRTWSTTPSPT